MEDRELALIYNQGMKSLVDFRRVFHPSEKEAEPANFHWEWSNILLQGKKHFAIEAFRESAKSTYVDEEFPCYCLTYPRKDLSYIVFILSNQDKASGKLREICNIYMSDPLLCANLVKINENSAKALDVIVEDMEGNPVNIRIEAYGKGSNIRGLKSRDRRPDIVIIDDPQDEEDSRSQTVLENDWRWFMSDVYFLGQFTRIFAIGNNLGDKCLMEMIINNHELVNFDVKRLPILIEKEEGALESAWPSRWTVEDIIKERENFATLGQIDIWFRNKMCIAMAPENQVFKKEWFQYFKQDSLKVKGMSVYLVCDLAISEKKTADRTWIMAVGVTPENHWFILDAEMGRFDAVKTMDKIFDMVVKWKPIKVGIEKVAYQAALEQFIKREMPIRNVFFTIAELKAEGKKVERIKMLQPRFATQTIWFPEGKDWVRDLEIELLAFGPDGTRGLHDDGPDALAYVSQIGVPPVRHNMKFENCYSGLM